MANRHGGRPLRAYVGIRILEKLTMADTMHDSSAELRTHRRTLQSFERLVLLAILHVSITLACLALAFLAHVPLIALVIWIAGTLAMTVTLAVAANYNAER